MNVKSDIPSRGRTCWISLLSFLSDIGLFWLTWLTWSLKKWTDKRAHYILVMEKKNQHKQTNTKRSLTTELRFVIPPACRPISARPLASSTLFTPQLGAMFPLQRMWTFILHTGQGARNAGGRTEWVRQKSTRWWLGAAPTFTLQPLLDDPPQQRTAVVAEGGRLVVVDAELVRDVDAEARARRLGWEETSSVLGTTDKRLFDVVI